MERTSYGKYKSAYRNFSVDSTSDADREAIERGLDVSQELLDEGIIAATHSLTDRAIRLWPEPPYPRLAATGPP